jgi:hypothetical protein
LSSGTNVSLIAFPTVRNFSYNSLATNSLASNGRKHHEEGKRPDDEQHRYHLLETTCDEPKHVFLKPLRELQRSKRYIGEEDDSL